MFRKVLVFSLLIMLMWTNTGYADVREFFGMKILNPRNLYLSEPVDLELAKRAFTLTSIDKKGKVHYKCDLSITDDSIYCYAWLSDKGIVIDIYNYSKMPIEFNSFADKYYLISKDESFYMVTIDTIRSYPKILNPKNHLLFSLDFDTPGVNISEIIYVAILLDFGKCCLFLKQIEK